MTINFCPKASPCPAILSPPLLTHLSLPIFLPTPEEEEGGQSPWAWLPASPCLRHCSLIQPLSWGGGEKGHLLKPSPAPLPHLLPSQGAGWGEDLVLGPRFWTLPAHPILAPWPAAAMPSLARLLLWGGASLGDRGAWWAAGYGVAQSRTWVKRLSSSSKNKKQVKGLYFKKDFSLKKEENSSVCDY